jgi:hypothetical protein
MLYSEGIECSHEALLEVLAASLNHESFSSFVTEEHAAQPGRRLQDAEVVVVNIPNAIARATELSSTPTDIAGKCIAGLLMKCQVGFPGRDRSRSVPVFRGVQDLYCQFASPRIESLLANEEAINAVLSHHWNAEAHLILARNPEIDESLWEAQREWQIQGDVSFIRTRGGRLELPCPVSGFLQFDKAGRAGLILKGDRQVIGHAHGPDLIVDCFTPNVVVPGPDSSMRRPWIGIALHPYSHAIMGCVVSDSADLPRLQARTIVAAYGTATSDGEINAPSLAAFDSPVLLTDGCDEGSDLARLLGSLGMTVKPMTKASNGRIEHVIGSLQRSFTPYANRGCPPPVMTMGDLSTVMQCNVTRHNDLIHGGDSFKPLDKWKAYPKRVITPDEVQARQRKIAEGLLVLTKM